ncbi:hypothetical protein EGW08_004749 [Elysia chlorotica]|uniref:Ig-like domain-containing protein n=1 Tax=Elysia chlorotica TaxID=188477 RepID=A0A3S1BS63_ELYCH|nr:hypothetical protein EGW08_004749 [Elysia chlorotica]
MAPHPEELLPPTFRDTPETVRVREGETARLRCAIDNLGTKKVTWSRIHETNPLTIETNTFVQDKRFKVEHEPLRPDWNLIIEEVKRSDEGRYVCQVSTTYHLRKYVYLKVVRKYLTSKPHIIFLKQKPLVLTCSAASDKSSMPDEIDWFFEGQILATDSARGLSIKKNVEIMNRSISSILRIESAQMSDAGTYICRTSASQMGRVIVDVLNADSKNSKRGTEKNSKEDRYDIAKPRHDRFDRDEEQGMGAENGGRGLWSPPAALEILISVACVTSVLSNWANFVGGTCWAT